ncbi:hypothetical protein CAAN1_01S13652 [[Candida] anglica]
MASLIKNKLPGYNPQATTIDYEELEEKFQIHKYYPKYFHNYDYSTPVIKDLIANKPIYSKANDHVKRSAARQAVSDSLEVEKGNIPSCKDRRKEKRMLHKVLKEEKKELKKDQREEKKELRKEHRVEMNTLRHDQGVIKRGNEPATSVKLCKDWDKPLADPVPVEIPVTNNNKATNHVPMRNSTGRYPDDTGLQFKDPFDSAATLIPHDSFTRRSVKSRNNSIATKFRSLLRSENSDGSGSPTRTSSLALHTSSSYDQTRSNMTKSRTKSLFNKLKVSDGRRQSEQVEVVTETVNNGRTGEPETIQYTQSQMVGHGSFGVVFQTQLVPSNEIAAIKRVLQDKRFKNRELQIMKLVHHRNIVDLKHYFYTNNEKNELYLNLILEFVPETLYKASHYYVSKRLSMPSLEVKLYTYQMLRALNYIHSQGICHRDIKPQNLLIDPTSGVLKLCDFGSAKILNPNEPNVSYICSRYYRAPELIFGATNYTTKIDVWSAGCVMAELILGQPLFPGESGIDQLVEIIKILGTPSRDQIKNMNPNYVEYTFPQIKPIPLSKIFRKMSSDCIQFLSRVLQYSPVDRVSCIEALCDPYFDELRSEETKLPNYRKLFSQQQNQSYNHNNSSNSYSSNAANYQLYESQPDSRELPELFDFDDREFSVNTDLNHHLVPDFALGRINLRSGKKSLDGFIPLTAEELKVTLD